MSNENQKVSFTIEVRDDGSAVVKGFEGASSRAFKKVADEAEASGQRQLSTFEKMKTSMAQVRQRWLAITAATAGATYFIKDNVQAFLEADAAENRLAATMANAGNLTKQNIETLKRYAEVQMKLTGYDDDLVIANLQLLETYRSQDKQIAMTADQLKTALSAALDLAAGKQMDLGSAVDLVGKAYAGHTEMLGRYGIAIDENIPKGQKFQALLDSINRSVGGSAQAEMNSYAGQVRYLTAVYGNIKEDIGFGFVKVAEDLLLIFRTLSFALETFWSKMLTGMATFLEKASGIPIVGSKFAGIATELKIAGDTLKESADADYAAMEKLSGMLWSTGAAEDKYKNNVVNVGTASADTADKIKKLADIMKQVDMVIAEAGMSEHAKELYEINAKYKDLETSLKELELSSAKYADAKERIAAARLVELTAAETREQNKLRDALIETEHAMVEQINAAEELIGKYPELTRDQVIKLRERANAGDAESVEWYKDIYTKEIDARREANDKIKKDNEEMLRAMEQSWDDYMNIILANYDDFGSMMNAIGRKMVSDLVKEMFSAKALFGSATEGGGGLLNGIIGKIFGGGGGSGMLSNVPFLKLFSGAGSLFGFGAGAANPALSGMMNSGMTAAEAEMVTQSTIAASESQIAAQASAQASSSALSTVANLAWVFAVAKGLIGGFSMMGKAGDMHVSSGAAFTKGFGQGVGTYGWESAAYKAGGKGFEIARMGIEPVGGAMALMYGDELMKMEKEMKMAGEYSQALQGMTKDLDKVNSLEQLFHDKEASRWLENTEAIKAYMKYSEIEGKGLEETLTRIGGLTNEYRTAIETTGSSSLQTIATFKKMGMEAEYLQAASVAWNADAQGIAGSFLTVYEKIKQLQLKAVTDELAQGATTFTAAMEKISMLDLGDAATNTLKYNEALKLLTTESLPALNGELTTARDLLKSTAEEIKKQTDATAGVDVKTQLLLSDLKLTEAQLRAIKDGTVNIDMINLARMMGDWDAQIVIVTTDSKEAVSVWKTLETATASLQTSLAGVAEKFKGLDGVNPKLIELYGNMQMTLAAVSMLAVTAQKLEKLDDVFASMSGHIEAADLAGLSADLVQLTDIVATTAAMFEQLAAAMRDIGAINSANVLSAIAGFLGPLGEIIMAIQLVIDLFLVGQGIFQRWMQDMTQDQGIATWVEETIIKPIEAIGPIGKKIAEEWRKNWFDSGEDVKKSLREVYEEEYRQQQLSKASSVYQNYAEKANKRAQGYNGQYDVGKQIDDIYYQGTQALRAYMQEYQTAIEEGRMDDAALLKQWMDAIQSGMTEEVQKVKDDWKQSIRDITATAGMTEAEKTMRNLNRWYQEQAVAAVELGEPIQDVTDAYNAQRLALIKAAMAGVNDIIATAGMTDKEKQVYAIDQRYNDLIATLTTYGATQEDIDRANMARRIELADLEKQELEARKTEFEQIISNIQQKIKDLTTSKYNIWANPVQMTANYGGQFTDAMAALRGSGAADFGKNYDTLQTLADKYLEQALSTYGNSAQYAAIYQQVMAGLQEALGLAQGQQTEIMTRYEQLSLAAQQDTRSYSSGAFEKMSNMKTALDVSNEHLKGLYIDANSSYYKLVEVQSQMSIANSYSSAIATRIQKTNDILTDVSGILTTIRNAITDTNKKGGTPIILQVDGREIARANHNAGKLGYVNH